MIIYDLYKQNSFQEVLVLILYVDGLFEERVVKAYHKLIKKEADIISSRYDQNLGGTIDPNCRYCLSRDELDDIFSQVGRTREEVQRIFNTLLEKGFLIEFEKTPESGSFCYRSLHMDVLFRSAFIRRDPHGEPRPARFKIYDNIPIPSSSDRTHGFGKTIMGINLSQAIRTFFGKEYIANKYVSLVKDFLSDLGTRGLDIYQARALERLLLSDGNKKVYVLTAPTGSGKTLIFSLYTLAKIIKLKYVKGEDAKVVFIYPRRVLQIDQTSRMLNLLRLAKKHGLEITVGMRDGKTPRNYSYRENGLLENHSYRGLRCLKCRRGILIYVSRPRPHLECSYCGETYDFIKLTRRDMGKEPPDILITNMWTVETRLIDSNSKDINVEYYKKVKLAVVDEAHEYTGLGAGLVSVLLKLMRKLSDLTFILSSATIPNPIGFAEKLTGIDKRHIEHLDFFDYTNKGGDIKGKRLVIMAVLDINPRYSWNTYVQLWSVYMSFLHYVYMKDKREYLPQAIVFINNIRELRRALRGYEENINLGEPKDHLYIKEQGSIRPPTDPFSYSHYASSGLLEKIIDELKKNGMLRDLIGLVGEMHSQIPEEMRKDVVAKLKGGRGLGVVLSTSSLELGVDYDNVGFVLNSGFENLISLVQRIGRGGRSIETMRTVLGLIITRNVPHESYYIFNNNIWNMLNPAPYKINYKIPLAVDNTQVIKRGILTEALARMAGQGEETYASGRGIRSYEDLKDLLSRLASSIKELQGWS